MPIASLATVFASELGSERGGVCHFSCQVVNTTRTPLGSFQAIAPCAACSGTGDMSPKCQKCNGEGRVNRNKRVTLKVKILFAAM